MVANCDECGEAPARISPSDEGVSYWRCSCSIRAISNHGAERFVPESALRASEERADLERTLKDDAMRYQHAAEDRLYEVEARVARLREALGRIEADKGVSAAHLRSIARAALTDQPECVCPDRESGRVLEACPRHGTDQPEGEA